MTVEKIFINNKRTHDRMFEEKNYKIQEYFHFFHHRKKRKQQQNLLPHVTEEPVDKITFLKS
jgi:hypothetical protein